MSLSSEKMIELYRGMVRIRRFEEKVSELFSKGLIPGFVHLYIGEEAVAVGVCANLTKNDYITSTHRGHGHCIAKGADLRRMMAELFGKKTGYCKGKGGSMHIADYSSGILGANAIVGANIPIAAGAAFAAKSKGTNHVAVAFFGDGASNTGAFHEGINIAAAWKLPVVFVCENNLYAISTRTTRSTPISNIADRAASYGIPGVIADGMDVMAVYESVHKAVEKARKGQGPTLVECKTYRFYGSFEGDPQRYRTKSEREEWQMKDPLNFGGKLVNMGVLTDADLQKIDQEVKSAVEEAVKYARESPYPEPEEVTKDLFA
ncbi:MAG: thiamine pyrophosphate-dependent dehydrogenase E1 component subunit alpha [Candidatus Bathyarchaeia archaeon]